MLKRAENWWSRPAGLRETLALALPLIVSTLSWTIMYFTDRVFLYWDSSDSVGAALPAGNLSFAVICLPLGIASYVNTFVAQYHGAGRAERIGPVVWQGAFVGLASAPLVMATIPLAPWVFNGVGHDPRIASLEIVFYQTLSWGTVAIVISAAFSSFFTGRGKMRTVMIVDSSCAALNAILDYAWIFGKWGFPEGGIEGAAWATVVATWARAAIYLVLWLRPRYCQTYQTWAGCRPDWPLLGRLLKFGSPNGLQLLLEVGAFGAFLLLVGKLGSDAMSATSIAFSVNSLAFMPVYGIGLATSTLVGQRLGENRPDLAWRGTWSAFSLAGVLTAVVAATYLFAPGWLLWAHGLHVSPQEFSQTKQVTAVLLRFVAIYCFFDAMNIVFSSAIKGAGDTRFVLLATLALSGVPVALTWLGLNWFGGGLYWCWVAVSIWVCSLGIVFWLRFLHGPWRRMRVIEPSALDPLLVAAANE